MITLLSGRKRSALLRCFALAVLALAALSACGQKGPLYLPEPAPEAEPADEGSTGL